MIKPSDINVESYYDHSRYAMRYVASLKLFAGAKVDEHATTSYSGAVTLDKFVREDLQRVIFRKLYGDLRTPVTELYMLAARLSPSPSVLFRADELHAAIRSQIIPN